VGVAVPQEQKAKKFTKALLLTNSPAPKVWIHRIDIPRKTDGMGKGCPWHRGSGQHP
jgi:hypothetical protein